MDFMDVTSRRMALLCKLQASTKEPRKKKRPKVRLLDVLGKRCFVTFHADDEDAIKMMKLMTHGKIGWFNILMLLQREEALMFDFAT